MHRQKPANEHPATESGPAPTPTPAPTVSSGPFLGVSVVIPGTVEAEEFDYGGEGVGYHDTSAGNDGGVGSVRNAIASLMGFLIPVTAG